MIGDLLRLYFDDRLTPSGKEDLIRRLDELERRVSVLRGWLPLGGTSPKLDSASIGTLTITNRITLEGDGTMWDDLRVPMSATKLGGSKDPGFSLFKDDGAGSQGVFLYWFDASTEEELYFAVQMPHQWKGTALKPHVHWTPKTTADGSPANQKVVWGLEYTWIDLAGDFANTSTVTGSTHTPADANVVAGRHYITALTTMTPSATQDGISSMLVCRLYRVAADAADNYEHDAGLLQFDFHFEIDSLGSDQEYTK
jgi:hypothetical protein